MEGKLCSLSIAQRGLFFTNQLDSNTCVPKKAAPLFCCLSLQTVEKAQDLIKWTEIP